MLIVPRLWNVVAAGISVDNMDGCCINLWPKWGQRQNILVHKKSFNTLSHASLLDIPSISSKIAY